MLPNPIVVYHEPLPTAGSGPNKTKSIGQRPVWGQWGTVAQTDYCEAPKPAFHVWSHTDPYLVRVSWESYTV